MPPEDSNTFGTKVGLGYDPNAYDLPASYAPTTEPNPMSDDPVLRVLGYIKTADQVLDKYVYTAQESDQAAIAKLQAQAALEAAKAAQVGGTIRVQPTEPNIPWVLIIGGGVVLVGLILLLRKED